MAEWLHKPPPRARVKARRKREFAKRRKEAREATFQRAKNRCERCDRVVSDEFPEWHPARAHVNEKRPRSLGGSALALDNLELLCRECHLPMGRHAPTEERMRRILRDVTR